MHATHLGDDPNLPTHLALGQSTNQATTPASWGGMALEPPLTSIKAGGSPTAPPSRGQLLPLR